MYPFLMDEELPLFTLPEPQNHFRRSTRMRHVKIINGASDYVVEDNMADRDRDLCNECNVNKIAYMICMGCVTLFCDSCTDLHLKKSECKGEVKRFINWNMLFSNTPHCEYHPATLCNVFCNSCLGFTCKQCVEDTGTHNCQNHLDSSISMYRDFRYRSWVCMQETRFWVESFYNLQTHVETRFAQFVASIPIEHSNERMELMEKKAMFAIVVARVRQAAGHITSCKELADEYDQRDTISIADMMKIMQICDFDSKREFLNGIIHETCEYLRRFPSDDPSALTLALPDVSEATERTPLHFDSCLPMAGGEMFQNITSVAFTGDLGDDSRLLVVDKDRAVCNIITLGEPMSRFTSGLITVNCKGSKAIFSDRKEKFVVTPSDGVGGLIQLDVEGNSEKILDREFSALVTDICIGSEQETVLLERKLYQIVVIDESNQRKFIAVDRRLTKDPVAVAVDAQGDFLLLDKQTRTMQVIHVGDKATHTWARCDCSEVPIDFKHDLDSGKTFVVSTNEDENFLTVFAENHERVCSFRLIGVKEPVTSVSSAHSNVIFVSTKHYIYSFRHSAFGTDA